MRDHLPYAVHGIGYVSPCRTLEAARARAAQDRLGGAAIYVRLDVHERATRPRRKKAMRDE